jgi:predicted Zn-dependent peptidase
MKRFLQALMLCIAIVFSVYAEQRKNPAEEIVRTTECDTLANGLISLICPLGNSGTVSLQIWVKTGSRNDPVGLSGMSHLFEHLMFRGSAQVASGDYRNFIESYGGKVAAFTTEDVIVFQADFPSAILEHVLAMEADRFASLTLSNETIAQERQTVLAERSAKVDAALRNKILEQLHTLTFPSHPYGRTTYGLPDDLRAITLADCESYFNEYFHPGNLILIVCGDVKSAQTRQWIESFFSAIPIRKHPETIRRSIQSSQLGPQRLDMVFSGGQDQMVVGWHIPDAASADMTYLRLLSRVFDLRYKSGRLNPADKRLGALDFHVAVDDRRDAGLFVAEISGKWPPDLSDPVAAWAGLLEESKWPVSPDEAELAKSLYLSDLGGSLDGTQAVAERLGYAACYIGGIAQLPAEQDRATKAVADDLNRVRQTYLVSNHRSAVVARGGGK